MTFATDPRTLMLKTVAEGRVMQSFTPDDDDRSKNEVAVDLLIERGYRRIDAAAVAELVARFDNLRDSGICSPTTRGLLDDAQRLLTEED